MPQKIRTFIAVEMSPAVRHAAAELIGKLAPLSDDVKWVEPHNMHLTLKFLGDVDEADIPRVCEATAAATADRSPFTLRMFGVGAFPNVRRPRTIWVGAREGSEETVELAVRIDRAMRKLGFPKEGRRYTPHLTLGRVRRGGPWLTPLGEALAQHAALDLAETRVDRVVVFSSQLGRKGPTYTPLGQCRLGSVE